MDRLGRYARRAEPRARQGRDRGRRACPQTVRWDRRRTAGQPTEQRARLERHRSALTRPKKGAPKTVRFRLRAIRFLRRSNGGPFGSDPRAGIVKRSRVRSSGGLQAARSAARSARAVTGVPLRSGCRSCRHRMSRRLRRGDSPAADSHFGRTLPNPRTFQVAIRRLRWSVLGGIGEASKGARNVAGTRRLGCPARGSYPCQIDSSLRWGPCATRGERLALTY